MAHDTIVEKIAEPVSRLACQKCGVSFDVQTLPMLSPVACPACGHEQFVPARLSGFLLLEVLGKGGMAAVYRAYDENLGRMVAIKILRPEIQKDPTAVQHFIREARAAAQLNHPNIVQVYTVGQAKGQTFLVMELLDGGRLDESIAADREVDEIRALEVGIAIARGLKSANDIGLIHGDIKPANILFDRAGTPKIADFGLARFKRSVVARGEIWGTPYYIAPEKVRKQKEDHRSDIYSLGATLYHALGGQPPFDGKTATDVVVARLKEPPLRITTIRPNLHPATVEVVSRMLEGDRSRRYPTYTSLIADLRRALDETKSNPVPGRTSKPPARLGRRLLWVAAAVLVLGAIAGTLWRKIRSTPSPAPDVSNADQTPSEPEPPVVAPEPVQEEETVSFSLQPFSEEEGRRLADTLSGLGTRTALNIGDELISHLPDMDRDHAGRPWYAFWYAFPVWLNGNAEETERRLRGLNKHEFEPPAEGKIAPGELPRALARVLVGEPFNPPGRTRAAPVSETDSSDEPEPGQAESTPAASDAPELPKWYLDLADGVLGLAEISLEATRPVGRLRLQRYLEAEVLEDVPWAYAPKGAVRAWMEKVEAWESFKSGLAARIKAGAGDQVLAQLQSRSQSQEWGFLKTEITDVLKNARRLKARYDRRLQQEQQQAEARALQERVKEERKMAESFYGGLVSRIQQLDFTGALEFWNEQTRSIETEAVGAEVEAMARALERMTRLKQFLGREIRRRPYPHAQRALRGEIVQAGRNGVIVSLSGGVGMVEHGWPRVGPRIFSDMVTFYLRSTRALDPEKAELAQGLAVFFHINGAVPAASAAAANAIRWNPDMADDLKKILSEEAFPDGN